MKIHRLKCYKRFFTATINGDKAYEIRKNDRGYELGDLLELCETEDAEYTGRCALLRVVSILTDDEFPEGIKPGYVILGTERVTSSYIDPEITMINT